MNTQELFPVTIGRERIVADTDFSNIEWRRSDDDNGWISTNTRLLELEQFSDLKLQVLMMHKRYCDSIGIVAPTDWRIQNSWANKHEPGDWAQKHHHSNSAFSGVYYAQVESNTSGAIQFHKSHATVSTASWEYDFVIGPHNAYTWGFQPQTGDIVFFPSHLEHSVTPNTSTTTRISIAWNILPAGEWGHGLHQTYR